MRENKWFTLVGIAYSKTTTYIKTLISLVYPVRYIYIEITWKKWLKFIYGVCLTTNIHKNNIKEVTLISLWCGNYEICRPTLQAGDRYNEMQDQLLGDAHSSAVYVRYRDKDVCRKCFHVRSLLSYHFVFLLYNKICLNYTRPMISRYIVACSISTK